MHAGPTIPIVSATWRACSISSRSRIDMPLIDSPPFDWIIVRAIALRQRPSRSQKTSIENSSPTHSSCTIDSTGVWREEELELGRVGRAVDVPRAEALADLDEQGIARIVRHLARQPRPRALDAVLLEEHVRDVLVGHRRAHLVGRREQQGGLEQVAPAGEDALVDVGDGHDELDVVLGHERSERGEVAGIGRPAARTPCDLRGRARAPADRDRMRSSSRRPDRMP